MSLCHSISQVWHRKTYPYLIPSSKYVIKKYVLLSFCLQRIQPYVIMYGIKNYVLMSFWLQRIQPYVIMYVIKNYVLMSLCLQRIQPYVIMYGIGKHVPLSFCLKNIKVLQRSFCYCLQLFTKLTEAQHTVICSMFQGQVIPL